MSEIALYNILKKIDGTTDDEIEKAVSDVVRAKDVAPKLDIAELKAEMYKLHMRTIMWLIAVGLGVVGLIKYL